MESQPQNPEFRNNPENFHPCILTIIRRINTTSESSKAIQLIIFQHFSLYELKVALLRSGYGLIVNTESWFTVYIEGSKVIISK